MDRRTTIATLLGKKASSPKQISKANQTTSAGVNTLEPYTGPWGFEQAAHLLRRVSFGPNYDQIKDAISDGLDLTLAQVLTNDPTTIPVYVDYNDDPEAANGESWIFEVYPDPNVNAMLRNQVRNARVESLVGWQMDLLLQQTISIREKMTLFWHNHFPISDINDPTYVYRYSKLLRDNCLGNFKQLVKDITIDGAMLRYLNGRDNTDDAPNENYARELLELFSIGKGPIAGPGDYTNYTEDDVREMARVLTGWKDRGFNNFDPDTEVIVEFTPWNHDEGSKQLSHRFDNAIIENAGELEYANLVDIIFTKDECARFICRKLYRWFVYYEIPEEVETNVIQPMAQIMIDNNYEVLPALEALLKSAHFYDSERIGCMIKNPIDFTLSLFKTLQMPIPDVLKKRYQAGLVVQLASALLQMQYFNPPSVSGWTAYYQAPGFYQLWINSVTLPLRFAFGLSVIAEGVGLGQNNDSDFFRTQVNGLTIIDSLDNPSEINPMLDELSRLMFARPISEGQRTFLKQILIPGLPDFEWNVEYSEYASDPGNEEVAMAVGNKVNTLLLVMTNMPEFQLS